MNNLEFDHADIFESVEAIERQFHHLVRTVPGNGLLIYPEADSHLQKVIAQGAWTPTQTLGRDGWQAADATADGSAYTVMLGAQDFGRVSWELTGEHNVANGLVAIAAARHAGIPVATAIEALCQFRGVKRRMEVLGEFAGVTVYDDFAHHPTAIATTLAGLRAKVGSARIIAVIEPRSNTMRLGTHQQQLASSTEAADAVFWYQPAGLSWNLDGVIAASKGSARIVDDIETLVQSLLTVSRAGDHIVIMSNGGFGGLHQRLVEALSD